MPLQYPAFQHGQKGKHLFHYVVRMTGELAGETSVGDSREGAAALMDPDADAEPLSFDPQRFIGQIAQYSHRLVYDRIGTYDGGLGAQRHHSLELGPCVVWIVQAQTRYRLPT